MVYSANEVVDILFVLECRRGYRPAARLYRERYPNRLRYPSVFIRLREIVEGEELCNHDSDKNV